MHDGIPFVNMVEPRKLLRNYAYHLKLFMWRTGNFCDNLVIFAFITSFKFMSVGSSGDRGDCHSCFGFISNTSISCPCILSTCESNFLDWSFTSASSYLSIYLTLVFSYQEGDLAAQEDMLRKQSRNVVSAVASRNIFQLVWGNWLLHIPLYLEGGVFFTSGNIFVKWKMYASISYCGYFQFIMQVLIRCEDHYNSFDCMQCSTYPLMFFLLLLWEKRRSILELIWNIAMCLKFYL